MSLRSPLSALLLLAALSACSGSVSKTQQNAPQATQVLEVVSETNIPAIIATATPNGAGTRVVLELQGTQQEKADQRDFSNRTSTMQALVNRYVADTATAAAPFATAHERALSTSNAMINAQMTQSADSATQTKAAPADAATAVYLVERAKWAALDAFASPVGILFGGMGIFVISVALAYVIATRPQIVHLPPAEFAPYAPLPFSQSRTSDGSLTWTRRVVPGGVREVSLIEMSKKVLTSRRKNGVPFSRQYWLHLMPRAEWEALILYMVGEGYAVKNNPQQANSGVSLTGTGESYLYQFEQLDTSPTEDGSAESGGLSSASQPGKADPTSGAVVDPFKISPKDGE